MEHFYELWQWLFYLSEIGDFRLAQNGYFHPALTIAIVATARKLAELMYTLLKNGTSYEKRTSPTVSIEKLVDEALAS